PIQALTLRDGLAGRDVSGRAPTGSGKTIAFGIPLVVDCRRAKPKRPRRLVLVPTRELATQVCNELRALAGREGPRIDAIFGGVAQSRQVAALRRGVDIVVACPGRLTDLINQNQLRLDGIDMVVLDEADRMADMGFLPAVRELLDQCPADRKTLLFSATLDGDVDVLVRKYQNDPVRHEFVTDSDEASDVEHLFWSLERADRVAVASAIVDRVGPTVVFCRTKHGAERVAEQMNRTGALAVAIHGDRSQAQRDRALEQFRNGRANALVATDVAARGIHVDDVAAVIHFDPPADSKDYVHRSGRTGRAGRRGVVISLVPKDQNGQVKRLQRTLEMSIGFDVVDLNALEAAERGEQRPALAHTIDTMNARPSDRPERARRSEARSGRARAAQPERTRSRDDRGRNDRSYRERSNDDRFRNDRARDDRPRNDRARDDRPRNDRARDDRPRNDRARAGSARDDRPRRDRSRDERTGNDRFGSDQPRRFGAKRSGAEGGFAARGGQSRSGARNNAGRSQAERGTADGGQGRQSYGRPARSKRRSAF
ncbi:MAG: DEAD/DEAH box helicase, partial [Acidimicrobiia bacterium]